MGKLTLGSQQCHSCKTRATPTRFTGPDGLHTLCSRCQWRYRNLRLPVYRDKLGKLTALASPDAELVPLLGFERDHRGRQNLLRPITTEARPPAEHLWANSYRTPVITRLSSGEPTAKAPHFRHPSPAVEGAPPRAPPGGLHVASEHDLENEEVVQEGDEDAGVDDMGEQNVGVNDGDDEDEPVQDWNNVMELQSDGESGQVGMLEQGAESDLREEIGQGEEWKHEKKLNAWDKWVDDEESRATGALENDEDSALNEDVLVGEKWNREKENRIDKWEQVATADRIVTREQDVESEPGEDILDQDWNQEQKLEPTDKLRHDEHWDPAYGSDGLDNGEAESMQADLPLKVGSRWQTAWRVHMASRRLSEEEGWPDKGQAALTPISVKASCLVAGRTVMRRFTADRGISFTAFQSLLRELFGAKGTFVVRYKDDCGDDITVSSDNEIAELFSVAGNSSLSPVHMELLSA